MKKFVQENKYNVGLDAAILMNPEVWVASGHVGGFSDPLIDCKECKTRHRADKLIEEWAHENWIKAGVEYVNGKQNVSAVVTHRTSDWSVVQLPDAPRSIWIKAVRRLDAVEIFFSRDDKEYIMMRTCWLQDNCPVMVGLMGACPDGKGFTATFEEFKVTPLADQRRLEWAKKQMNK